MRRDNERMLSMTLSRDRDRSVEKFGYWHHHASVQEIDNPQTPPGIMAAYKSLYPLLQVSGTLFGKLKT